MTLFKKVIPTGIKHGTVTVIFKRQQYEVTTFRVDGDYADSRHPDSVSFVRSLEQDLARRDFTINALAVNAFTGDLTDLHHGLEDLENGIVRAIGNAGDRLKEDALRIVRACRFAGKLDFSIEADTFEAMKQLAPKLKAVSGERIHEELNRMLLSKRPSRAFELMHSSGVLAVLLPELEACAGVEQGGYHIHDVLTHSLLACDAAARSNFSMNVRYAALFHDMGKPQTRAGNPDEGYTFYKHEFISEKLAAGICERLKFSRADSDRILLLIRNHMFHYTEDWTDAAVRRFIKRVGVEALDDLFALHMADQEAIAGQCDIRTLGSLPQRINAIIAAGNALSIKDLAINGQDLISSGIPAGPHMGTILAALLDEVLDNPEKNTGRILLQLARIKYEALRNG